MLSANLLCHCYSPPGIHIADHQGVDVGVLG
jgi:hypothetical protein